MKTNYLKSLLIVSIISSSLYATNEQRLLENSWINVGYSNAKDTMMGGATTATGKGYSALFTNPAGLSTNYATGIYFRASEIEHKNATGSTNEENALSITKEENIGDSATLGIFYKYFVMEMKPDVHNALAFGYGIETDYGLISGGFNYVVDETTVENYQDLGTGDYYTVGLQWQKSYIGLDDFYAFYFGFSKKGQGVNIIEGEQVGQVSPLVDRMGVGFETNVFSTTLLVSYDLTTQHWHHISDSLDTQAIGLKWMMGSGYSTAFGYSTSTYNTEVDLSENTAMSFGLEFGFWNANVAIAVIQKEVLNKAGKVYSQDNSVHADISFAF